MNWRTLLIVALLNFCACQRPPSNPPPPSVDADMPAMATRAAEAVKRAMQSDNLTRRHITLADNEWCVEITVRTADECEPTPEGANENDGVYREPLRKDIRCQR